MRSEATRGLRVDERDLAVATLVASFDDDPWFRWALPDARARRAWVGWFHGVSVECALDEATAYTLDEGPAAGAITIMPPGVRGPDVMSWVRAARRPPRAWPSARLLTVGMRTQSRLDAAHPREPVVYVHVLGVHPSRKGEGLGGALMGVALELAARRNVPLFLETSNPANLGFYARFGLSVRDELRVGDAPPIWTLQTEGVPARVGRGAAPRGAR